MFDRVDGKWYEVDGVAGAFSVIIGVMAVG